MSGYNLTNDSICREYIFGHAWLGDQAMARSKKYKLIQKRNNRAKPSGTPPNKKYSNTSFIFSKRITKLEYNYIKIFRT